MVIEREKDKEKRERSSSSNISSLKRCRLIVLIIF